MDRDESLDSANWQQAKQTTIVTLEAVIVFYADIARGNLITSCRGACAMMVQRLVGQPLRRMISTDAPLGCGMGYIASYAPGMRQKAPRKGSWGWRGTSFHANEPFPSKRMGCV